MERRPVPAESRGGMELLHGASPTRFPRESLHPAIIRLGMRSLWFFAAVTNLISRLF